MTIEQLNAITESEALAEEIRKEAKAAAKAKREAAEKEAAANVEAARQAAAQEYRKAMEEAEVKAQAEFQRILNESQENSRSIETRGRSRMPQAVGRVKERIVNSSVNR